MLQLTKSAASVDKNVFVDNWRIPVRRTRSKLSSMTNINESFRPVLKSILLKVVSSVLTLQWHALAESQTKYLRNVIVAKKVWPILVMAIYVD